MIQQSNYWLYLSPNVKILSVRYLYLRVYWMIIHNSQDKDSNIVLING